MINMVSFFYHNIFGLKDYLILFKYHYSISFFPGAEKMAISEKKSVSFYLSSRAR